MQLISDNLKKTLNSANPAYIKKVLLYTRIWDGAQSKYIFNAPSDITRYIISLSPLKSKLDNEGYGIWNTANTTLGLSNEAGKFTPAKEDGFLPQGSILHGAKLEFFAGARMGEGLDEYAKIFRAFVLNAPVFDHDARSLTLSLSGELARLALYSAQEISLLTEGELLPSPDGQEFFTAHPAVFKILEARRGNAEAGYAAAGALKEDNDYQVSSLNLANCGACLRLSTPLQEGQSLWVSYRRWHTDKAVEWLAGEIASLSESECADIDPLSFSESVENTFAQPLFTSFSEGEHNCTGVKDNAVTLDEDFLKIKSFDWTISEKPGNAAFTLTPESVALVNKSYSGRATVWAPCGDGAYGTWEFKANCTWTGTERQFNHFISSSSDRLSADGYCFSHTKVNITPVYKIYRVDGGALTVLATVSYPVAKNFTEFIYRITRDKNGNFYLRIKPVDITLAGDGWGDLGLICTDNKYQTSAYRIISMVYNDVNYLSGFKYSPAASLSAGSFAPEGSYLSPALDAGADLQRWDIFTAEQDLNGCTAQTFYRTKSTLSAPWGEWIALGSNQAPQTKERFLQLGWFAASDAAQTKGPSLINWGITYYTGGANLSVVNLSSISCLEAMQELARLTSFKIGYDNDGRFLFKQRKAAEPCAVITAREILDIESISDGSDKLYNRVTVNFGIYSRTIDCFTEEAARPNFIDTYGLREYTVNSGSLLPSQNANIARAAAPAVYRHVSRIRRRIVVNIKFLPHLELGDTVALDYGAFENAPMLIEGAEIDLENWKMRLELAEV